MSMPGSPSRLRIEIQGAKKQQNQDSGKERESHEAFVNGEDH